MISICMRLMSGPTHHHANSSTDCKLTPADLIQDEDNDARASKLADIDHSREDDSVVLVLSESFEQCRRIVDECVDSRELHRESQYPKRTKEDEVAKLPYLLKEHDSHCDDRTAAVTSEEIIPNLQLQSNRTRFAVPSPQDLALETDFGDDALPFHLHTSVVLWDVAQATQRLERFVVAFAHGQPARRERKKMDAESDTQRWHHLKKEGQPPSPV